MSWDDRYRVLQKGEVVEHGDEVDVSNDWKDPPKWEKATQCIGEKAPDPNFTSHRVYRRLKTWSTN